MRVGNEQRQHQLEELGKEETATLTDVALAITNLMIGVNSQMIALENNTELNLNILIDALYKAELINDDVLDHIQDSIDKSEEEEKIKQKKKENKNNGKNISTHTKGISQEDMATWVEAITEGTVEGKEIDKETAKKLDRIGSRSVSLEEATRIAKVINAVSAQETTSAFNEAFNLIDLLMIILEDEVGVTEEQVSRAQKTLKEKEKLI
ncbi:hypothetical protein FMLHJGGC_00237 [Staphylococcus phage BSwM-KMM1]|nr:hypothetical protein FMLHJGGC_00237 [Pseudomonas phage BSwM KMM1]